MNQIVPCALEGEVVSPGSVHAFGYASPLRGKRLSVRVAAGLSIRDILDQALAENPGSALAEDFVVHVDGELVPREWWSRVRPKPGATITFIPRPKGGNVLKSVLMVAIAVAALVVAAPIAAGLGLTGTFLTIGTALISAGIVYAGQLALNALFPTRPKDVDLSSSVSSLNSIQGASNQAAPFAPIPVVLGFHRQSPFYAAKPYTEIAGDDQFLRLMFCWGYGPIDVSDLRIGDTPLSSYADVEVETVQGLPGDPVSTLYPADVEQDDLSLELISNLAIQGPEDDWVSQNTAANADEFSVDITAPEGVFILDSQTGAMRVREVIVEGRYRPAAGGAWTAIESMRFDREPSIARRSRRVVVSARGQYEVQLRSTRRHDPGSNVRDKVLWTAIRTFTNVSPVRFRKPLALTTMRIRATGQLSGVISTLNGLCKSMAPAWDGEEWQDDTPTRECADLFRLVLQGPANERPASDDEIDLENLQAWHAYCVLKGFAFDQVRTNRSSVYDALADIAAAGRAVPTFIDGRWGVVWDQADAPIVNVLSPRNSWGFASHRTYGQQPHGWRVAFINAENGYTIDERIVYDDGFDEGNATLFEALQFPGVTDPDAIWKHGRFHIAQARLRPEKVTLNVAWENLANTRGDRVRVTHDVMMIGQIAGRVKAVAGQVVTLDEQILMEPGKTYGIRFRSADPDVNNLYRSVVAVVGAAYQVELDGAGDVPDVGALFAFGESERETGVYRIQAIEHANALNAQLVLVDDAPEISLADEGVIPDYSPNISIPPDPLSFPPKDLQFIEVIDGAGGVARAFARLAWSVDWIGRIASFEVQARDEDGDAQWKTVDSVPVPRMTSDVPITSAGVWSFRVRSIFNDGRASAWAQLVGLQLAGLSRAPGDIVNLHFRAVDGQTVLSWADVIDQRAIAYEVRKGTSWDTGLVVGDAVVQPPWATTGDGKYHVRAYITSPFGARIYSENTSSIDVVDSIRFRNIIVSKDEQADGWPGGLDGGVIDGSFIRTDVGETIGETWATEIVSELSIAGLHVAIYLSPEVVDIGRAAECRFWTEYEASGVLQGADFLGQADVLGSGDVLGTSPTRFIRAFPIWRFAATGEGDAFSIDDIFAATDAFQSSIDWGDWVQIASGTRVARYFQPGFVLITDQAETDATGTKYKWFVDVPDRTDDYINLTVPDTGLDVTFYSGGFNEEATPGTPATPFNGGPVGASVPHVQRAIVDGTNGDEVKITNLTLTGCTVHVVNAGSNVTRSGVNLLIRGY